MNSQQKKQNNQNCLTFSDEGWELLEKDNLSQQDSALSSEQYDEMSLYFSKSGKPQPLSKGEDIALGKKIAESQSFEKKEQARQRLAEGSFYLLIHIAKEIKNQNQQLDIRDLIQAGYLGLMRAVDKYDYKRGIRFSTFSYWWIKKEIYESVKTQQELVHIPKWLKEQIGKYRKTSWQLKNTLGREPSLAEIAKSMNLPQAKVELIAIVANPDKIVYIEHLESQDESDSN